MKKLLLSILMVFTLFISCSKDSDNDVIKPNPPTPPTPPITEDTKIPISIIAQKADDSNGNFKSGDKVGLYVVNYNGSTAGVLAASGNQVNNIYFSYSGNWTPEKKIYWKDKSTKADLFCYYPYKSNISTIAAMPIAVSKNESSEEDYKASEFLWGKKTGIVPTESSINITVQQAMSKLIVKLVPGSGYKEEDLNKAEVVICGLKTNATINLADGVVTSTDNPTDITPMNMKNSSEYHAFVVPQNVKKTDLIKVTIDKNTFLLNESIAFTSNKQYTCTITIDSSSQGISIGIAGWDIDDKDYGDQIHNI